MGVRGTDDESTDASGHRLTGNESGWWDGGR